MRFCETIMRIWERTIGSQGQLIWCIVVSTALVTFVATRFFGGGSDQTTSLRSNTRQLAGDDAKIAEAILSRLNGKFDRMDKDILKRIGEKITTSEGSLFNRLRQKIDGVENSITKMRPDTKHRLIAGELESMMENANRDLLRLSDTSNQLCDTIKSNISLAERSRSIEDRRLKVLETSVKQLRNNMFPDAQDGLRDGNEVVASGFDVKLDEYVIPLEKDMRYRLQKFGEMVRLRHKRIYPRLFDYADAYVTFYGDESAVTELYRLNTDKRLCKGFGEIPGCVGQIFKNSCQEDGCKHLYPDPPSSDDNGEWSSA